MNETKYVSDCQGRLETEVYGYFQNLAAPGEKGKTVFCLVVGESDIQTISDLVLTCGYTEKSLLNKQVMISIVEND
jgi:hypothetical protein